MREATIYRDVLWAWFGLSAITFAALFLTSAPYGRHGRAGWGPTIAPRWGWLLMEAPAAIVLPAVALPALLRDGYAQGWLLLGAQTAGFVGFDKDVIPIASNEGGFRRLRVTVRDRAITLNELKVFYTDGSDETVPVRTRVDAGGTYGPIDLSGQRKQPIDHIEAKYRSRFFDSSAKGKGSAIVEIWGQH